MSVLKVFKYSVLGLGLAFVGTTVTAQVNNPGLTLRGAFVNGNCLAIFSRTQVIDSGAACANAIVQTVFGRSGNVVAQTGDYNFNQIAGTATGAQLAAGAAATNLGAAGGDLTGTYPNPVVGPLKIDNSKMAVGAASANLGAAGGDLTGTYPNPVVGPLKIDNSKLAVGAALANIAMVPIAKGGTNLDNTGAATNDTLAFNGTGFFRAALLTLINTVCTAIPTPCSQLFGFYSPQWFGAVVSPFATPIVSLTDSTTAIQAMYNAICAVNGGVAKFSAGTYASKALTITCNNVYTRGAAFGATMIVHIPTVPETLFFVGAGFPNMLSNIEFSDLSVGSGDITVNKTAFYFDDVSQIVMRNVNIARYPIGTGDTLYRGPTNTGTGISIGGRELGKFENVQVYANNPIRFLPAVGFTNLGLDSFNFHNLIAITFNASNCVITVAGGVPLSNIRFDGNQNWIGGLDGFCWIDPFSTNISFGLTFDNIKSEQASTTGGYTFNLQNNAAVYGLTIRGAVLGDRNGIFLRNTAGVALIGNFYNPNSNPTKNGLNADLTNTILDFSGNAWLTTTVATLGAFTTSATIFPTGNTAAIPASGVLYH